MKQLGIRSQWAPFVTALVVFWGSAIGAQVTNGGFEQATANGQLAGWTPMPDSADVRQDRSGKAGKAAARILVQAPAQPTGLISAPIGIVPETFYTASGWVRLADGGVSRRARLSVRWLSDRLRVLSENDVGSAWATGEEWTRIAAGVAPPDGARFAQIVCAATSRAEADAPFEAWFDAVAFTAFGNPGPLRISVTADSVGKNRAAQVRASITDSLDLPVADGFAVRFDTDRGAINAWAPTRDGIATATLRYREDMAGGALVRVRAGNATAAVAVGDVRAAVILGRVYNAESGAPLVARLALTDSSGATWVARHPIVSVANGAFVRSVPPGQVVIAADCGPEYVPPEPRVMMLTPGLRTTVDFPMQPWTHMANGGWYGGDMLVRSPADDQPWDVLPAEALLLGRAAGLHFALFADGLQGQALDLDTPVTQPEAFWALAGHFAPGHLGRQWVLGRVGLRDYDPQTPGFVVHAQARQARGLVGYTQPFLSGQQAGELPFSALSGPTFDALDVLSPGSDPNRAQALWFALLNRGLQVVATASSHAVLDDVTGPVIGRFRTYVQVGGDVTPGKLVRALAGGHVVVSSGPLLQFSAFAAGPGSELPVGRPRRARLRAWASGDRDDYLTRIELIRNAEVVQAWDLPDRPRSHHIAVTLHDSVACWYVARCYGADSTRVALTNPIFFLQPDAVLPEPIQAVVRGAVQTADGAPVPKAAVEVLNPLGEVVLQTVARNGNFQVWAPPTAYIRVTAPGMGGQTLRIFDDPGLQTLLNGLREGLPEALYADATFAALTARLEDIALTFTLGSKR